MMKIFNSIKCIVLGMVVFGFLNTGTACAQNSLRVLTFNIWDPADIPFWEKHANGFPVDKTVDYLTEDNADILLLQEVTLEAAPHPQAFFQIREKLFAKGYLYTAFYKPDYSSGTGTVGYIRGSKNSGYPLAIFSKFPVIETFAAQTLNGKTMSKGVLAVKVQVNDVSLYVCTTHLSIGEAQTNDEVSKVAVPFINQVAGDEPVIMGGDWNSPPAADFPDSSKKIGNYTYECSLKTNEISRLQRFLIIMLFVFQ
ncbi:MAG: endonuclease/exonuclease/phosphatase family protein, partial [Marinilabiliaceae bacterium]|nr:endonuclease/exonuclease/phosphatase family protein [Marinilabiliaceae bacterium]